MINKFEHPLPWTVNLADDVITPRRFSALQVYIPSSRDVTSFIIKPPRVCKIRLSLGRLEFCCNQVTWGFGLPLTSQWNDAVPVSFTTMETGGDTIEGEEIDSPGSPLGPWGPSLPLGPGSPWSPGRPLGPCGPWGPGGPYFPGGPLWPGLPLLPLTLFGQCTVQTWLLSARWTSFLMSFLVTNLLVLSNLYSFPKLRLWRNSVSAREIVL